MPVTRLAKLAPPRLHGAVARERLFVLLDKLRTHRVIWISGPPGAGKTTVAASYLETTRVPALWYLLDSGDSDPASFFYFLAQAVDAASRKRSVRLPLLTTEYLSDLEGFSHRFFRSAYAHLPVGSCLVLDNYHEIRPDSTLHHMLGAGVREIPQDGNLIVISRQPPSAPFARFRISNEMALLGWDELRLAPDETSAIVSARKALGAADALAIHQRAGGWVAGVRLLLEGQPQGADTTLADPSLSLETTFDYFAAEILDANSPEERSVLLRTAFFPRFTAEMACRISGTPRAAQVVDQMHRRRLFVDKRMTGIATYQYHDLFRTFLQNRAGLELAPEEILSLAGESATLLLDANLVDDAFLLLVQAKDWDRAEKTFLGSAQRLIAQGRWKTLAEWAGLLPPERLRVNPWLQFWLGRSIALVDAPKALPVLEAAYDAFLARSDGYGMVLCASAVIETLHFVVDNWNTMGLWLARLMNDVTRHDSLLTVDDSLRVHASLFWAAENSLEFSGPIVRNSAEKAAELLASCTDVNLRITAANMLHYHTARCLDARISEVAAREGGPVLDSGELSADRHALYYLAEGLAHMDFARFHEALECIDRADAIIAANGLTGRDHIAGVWRSLILYAAGRQAAAEQELARTETLHGPDLHVISQVLHNARSWIAFGRGQVERALECNAAAVRISETKGPAVVLAYLLCNRAYLLIFSGQVLSAREVLAGLRKDPEIVEFERVGASIALLEAWIALRLDRHEECREALRQSLQLARDDRDRLRMRWYPRATAELAAIALREGIEPEVARMLVSEHGLKPPVDAPQAWPWPVKILTLGRFAILLNGEPIKFGRKVPKRTLALLKALVAFGGAAIPEEKLADALWPDLDGDAAMDSLAAALHRLRRLLGSNDAIRQGGGRLSLGEGHCFVDSQAFDKLADSSHPDERSAALALYRGAFLEGETDAPWAALRRERLRGKFLRMTEAFGRDLESAGAYERAAQVYSRGIEADEISEPFYQGLMRCLQRLGRHSEAATVFEALRQALAASLGAAPSPESRNLFERMRSAAN